MADDPHAAELCSTGLVAIGRCSRDYVEPQKGSTLLLRSAHGRRAFWTERLQAARAAQDRDAEVTAERFLREYEQFIALLTEQAGAA